MKYFLLLTLGLLPFISKAQVSELFGGRFIFTQDTLITGSEDLYVVGIFKHPRTNFHVDSIQAGDILVDCDCNVFTVDTFYSSTGSIATLRVTPQDTSVNDIRSCTGGIMRAHSPPHDAFYHFPANIPLEIQDCFLNYNLSRLIEYEFGDGLTLTGDVVDLGGTYDSEILINSAGSDSFNITTNGMVELDVNGLRVHNGSTKGTIFFDEYSNTSWYIDALNGLSLHTSGATSADINFYRSGTKFAEASELQGLRIDRLTSWTETSGYVFNIHGYDVDTGDGGSIIMRGGQSSATNADGGYLKFYGGQVDTMYSGGFGGNPGYISFYTITDSNDSTTYGTYMPAIHMPGGTYAGNVSLSGAHNPTASVDIDGNLRTRGNPTTVEAYVLMSDVDGYQTMVDTATFFALVGAGGGSDGNGIISALPSADVNIDANTNDFRIYDLQEFKLTDSLALNSSWYSFKLYNSLTEGLSFKAGATTSVMASVDVNSSSGFIATGGGTTKDSLVLNDPDSRFNGRYFRMEVDDKFSVTGDTMDISGVTTLIGFPDGADGNGIFDATNEGATIAINTMLLGSGGLYLDGNQETLTLDSLGITLIQAILSDTIVGLSLLPDSGSMQLGAAIGADLSGLRIYSTRIEPVSDTLDITEVGLIWTEPSSSVGINAQVDGDIYLESVAGDIELVSNDVINLAATNNLSIDGSSIEFYSSYYFDDAIPSNTSGDTSIHVWVGDGVGTAEPMFIDKDQFFGGGGSPTPSIRNDLPTETVTIDPNTFNLIIGTNAANNSGFFEFRTLTNDTQDAILYVGHRDSSSFVVGEGFAFDAALASFGAQDGIIGVGYEYFGDVYNNAFFGDSMLVSSYPGSTLNYFMLNLPRNDTISAILVQDWTTGQYYVRDGSTIGGATMPGFEQDSIAAGATTYAIDLESLGEKVFYIDMTSANATITLSTTNHSDPGNTSTTVFTIHFRESSGTDPITWPANFYDMQGTALGTDNLTTGTKYTCYYQPILDRWYCN